MTRFEGGSFLLGRADVGDEPQKAARLAVAVRRGRAARLRIARQRRRRRPHALEIVRVIRLLDGVAVRSRAKGRPATGAERCAGGCIDTGLLLHRGHCLCGMLSAQRVAIVVLGHGAAAYGYRYYRRD